MKATRVLLSLDVAARAVGILPGVLLRLSERCPEQIPTEVVDGHRYFNPGDVERLAEQRASAMRPALEGTP